MTLVEGKTLSNTGSVGFVCQPPFIKVVGSSPNKRYWIDSPKRKWTISSQKQVEVEIV